MVVMQALVVAGLGMATLPGLALRAHRLVEPVTAPADLAGLPTDPADGPPSEPALSEAAFDARRLGVENALPRPLAPPG